MLIIVEGDTTTNWRDRLNDPVSFGYFGFHHNYTGPDIAGHNIHKDQGISNLQKWSSTIWRGRKALVDDRDKGP